MFKPSSSTLYFFPPQETWRAWLVMADKVIKCSRWMSGISLIPQGTTRLPTAELSKGGFAEWNGEYRQGRGGEGMYINPVAGNWIPLSCHNATLNTRLSTGFGSCHYSCNCGLKEILFSSLRSSINPSFLQIQNLKFHLYSLHKPATFLHNI